MWHSFSAYYPSSTHLCGYKERGQKKITCLFFHDSEHNFAKAIKLGLAEKVLTI